MADPHPYYDRQMDTIFLEHEDRKFWNLHPSVPELLALEGSSKPDQIASVPIVLSGRHTDTRETHEAKS